MYRLFYNRSVSGDVLFVLLDPMKKATKTERRDEVEAIYHEDEVIGYNIFDFSKTVRLNSHGAIFLPDDKLVDAVNSILSRTRFSLLPYPSSSGFRVMKILSLEEHPLNEKASIVLLLGEEGRTYATVSVANNLKVGSLYVAAMDKTILADGTMFVSHTEKNLPIDVLLMSPHQLKIGEDDLSVFSPDGGYQVGDDFFAPSKE